MIPKHILMIEFLNKPVLIFCPQLNGFGYFYLLQITLFFRNLHSLMFSIIAIWQK